MCALSTFHMAHATNQEKKPIESPLRNPPAQIASPCSQITIGSIAAVLEEAEQKARLASERGVTLQEYLGHGAIGDVIEQYNKKDNTYCNNASTPMTSSR